MSKYQTVLNYIQKQVRLNYFSEIVLPPVIAASEALKLSLEDTEVIYQEMLERCVIRQQSEYEYTLGSYFPLTEEIKRRLGTVSGGRY